MLFSLTVLSLISAVVVAAPINDLSHFIPNQWIVRVRSTSDVASIVAAARNIFDISESFRTSQTYAIGDFTAFTLNGPEALLRGLLSLDGVEGYEPDQVVKTVQGVETPAKIEQEGVEKDEKINPQAQPDGRVFQTGAPWNLARIAERELGSGRSMYSWLQGAGEGEMVYVLDTGILHTHREFLSLNSTSSSAPRISLSPNFSPDPNNTISSGHGTHVAGLIAGLFTGASKHTSLTSVKVLGGPDGIGSTTTILAGLDWVAKRHPCVAGKAKTGCIVSAVVNMSLGTKEVSRSFNEAVDNAVRAGIVIVAAAGNEGGPANATSPASAELACTVAALSSTDARASFSNVGSEVDVFAPGVGIKSAWFSGERDYAVLSGTSMAAPHVAGIAVNMVREMRDREEGAEGVCRRIREVATGGMVGDAGEGSPNLVLYNGLGTGEMTG